jgi:hypothetical protein
MAREAEREPATRTIRKSMNPEEPDSVPKLVSFINCKTLKEMQKKIPEKLLEIALQRFTTIVKWEAKIVQYF